MTKKLYPGIGQAVAERTILRKKDNGKLENWGDVAERVALGNSLLCKDKSEQEQEYQILKKHIENGVLLMSGRHLQHGDKDQPTRNMELFCNCAVTNNSFTLFYLLMNGSGVGRSYDDDLMLIDWSLAPSVRCVLSETHKDYEWGVDESVRDAKRKKYKDVIWYDVPDTREGWAKALEQWETLAYKNTIAGHKKHTLILDFSGVRPKGSPIAGMQGRPASGPKPLMKAFSNCNDICQTSMARWEQSMYIDHYFADCVLLGGARRSSRMSTKSWRDKTVLDFIRVKRPSEYHNKYLEEVTAEQIRLGYKPSTFLWSSNNSVAVDQEFWDLVKSNKNTALAKHAKAVFKLITQCSYGDGTGEPGIINEDKFNKDKRSLEKTTAKDLYGSSKYVMDDTSFDYLNELYDICINKDNCVIVNPCVTDDTIIKTSEGFKMVKDLIRTPFLAQVANKHYRSKGFYKTGDKIVFELTTKNGRSIKATKEHMFLVNRDKKHDWVELKDICKNDQLVLNDSLDYDEVESVIEQGIETVYDCSVEDVHCFDANGLIAHNCGEIQIFIFGGYCVIADVVPYHAKTLDEAEEAFRAAVRSLMRVNTMPCLFKNEVDRTNRIGVAMTGVHEFAWKFFKLGFRDLLDETKSIEFWNTIARFNAACIDEAIKYAKLTGREVPMTILTIKPSGTISKLFGLSEGWHLPSMAYYVRWVQFRNDDPLVEKYKLHGYPTRKLNTYQNTTIVGFPTNIEITNLDIGNKLVTAAEATPEEQYKWLKLGEKYWINGFVDHTKGNQISYSLKYKPDLVSYDEFADMLYHHQKDIKCCSVMPQEKDSSYEYLPEEMVSYSEFLALKENIDKKMKEDIDFAHLNCENGACPVDFKKD